MKFPLSRRMMLGATLASAAGSGNLSLAATAKPKAKPVVMGHRGCSALRPEHTLASYAKAIADGADFIEPDLVCTKDGVLVARHENAIHETTDAADHPEFASRRTTKVIDGESITSWFTEDFTLAELKTLRARERLTGMREESHRHDGHFQLVTFEEVADFVAAESAARGRIIGLIPELKHSTYFAATGLPLEDRFLATIAASAYLSSAPLIVQSFEVSNLKALRPKIASRVNIQLMQLIGAPKEIPADLAAKGQSRTWADLLTPRGLAEIASYAHWLAPNTRMLIPTGPDGRLGAPTGLAEAAHKAGLLVGTWTFRPENAFLAADFRNAAGQGARNEAGSLAEIRHYLALGLDGFFTDDPALGRRAVDSNA